MKIAVLEDNQPDRDILRSYIENYCRERCYAAEIETFATGEALLGAFCPGAFDLSSVQTYTQVGMALKEEDRTFTVQQPDYDPQLITYLGTMINIGWLYQ